MRVCEDSIANWENNRSTLPVKYYLKTIGFFGYMPFEGDSSTLGSTINNLKGYRKKIIIPPTGNQ